VDEFENPLAAKGARRTRSPARAIIREPAREVRSLFLPFALIRFVIESKHQASAATDTQRARK
jgi:hypothetical protein